MNLKVPGAILPLGCAILSTRAKTVRGATPLRRTRVKSGPEEVWAISALVKLTVTCSKET